MQVNWTSNYPPDILTRAGIPKFNTNFLDHIWSKLSHTIELNAMGYDFFVLPETFTVKTQHSGYLNIAPFPTIEKYMM